MGTIPLGSVSGEAWERKELIEKMDFIENREVAQLGATQIFRFKEAPYDYLIRHVKCFSDSHPEVEEYTHRVGQVATMPQHKSIAVVHYYTVERTFSMCSKALTIETYCNYYAITLGQVIEQRKRDDVRFTVGETWYVLKNLVEVSSFLKANKFLYGAYKPANITLSAEGYIKLYILHLNQHQNKNHPYYQALCDRKALLDHLPFPEEFLGPLCKGGSEFAPSHDKEDSFYIALVIMEMLIDDTVKQYYAISQTHFSFKRDYLERDMDRLRPVYGDHMMNLLAGMLCEDVGQRITPSQAATFIEEHREELNMAGALRMFEEENGHPRPKMSYRTSVDIENSLKNLEPNVLENKLTPTPIRTFTKKTYQISKSNCGVSLTSSKKSNEACPAKKQQSECRTSSVRTRISSLNMRMPR